jgi:hypothetical protein
VEDLPRLLAPAARVSVHLVVAVGRVVDANRLHPFLRLQEQDHCEVENFVALGRELNPEQRSQSAVEDAAIEGSHVQTIALTADGLLEPLPLQLDRLSSAAAF